MRQLFVDSRVKATIDSILAGHSIEDVVVIDAHQPPALAKNKGLDLVLEHADDGVPIILTTWLPATSEQLCNDMRWHACIGLPHLTVIELPAGLDGFLEAYQTALAAEKIADPLARELAAITLPTDILPRLKHDLKYAHEDAARRQQWLEFAQSVGYVGNFEDIAAKVESEQVDWPTPFAGRTLDGVFCDVEDTLIKHGDLDADVMGLLAEFAKTKPITLWTGGSTSPGQTNEWARLHGVRGAVDIVRQNQVPWKITSKWLFHGATMETAIDDEDQGALTQRYGFICRRFITA